MSSEAMPEELKPFAHRFLMRAKMMDGIAAKNSDPGAAKVAYYCRLKAVKSAMANQSSFDISKADISAFLGDLLSEAEGARTALGISAETEAADKVSVLLHGRDGACSRCEAWRRTKSRTTGFGSSRGLTRP